MPHRSDLYADSAQARSWDVQRDAFVFDAALTREQALALRQEEQESAQRLAERSRTNVRRALGELEDFFVNRHKGA